MGLYNALYEAVLSKRDAEQTHKQAVRALRLLDTSRLVRSIIGNAFVPPTQQSLRCTDILGLSFEHPLGLAAGFDKDAECLYGVRHMGFSFIEVGTVAPLAQPGNPQPRMWRLLEDDALINRLGFPGQGMEHVAEHLNHARYAHFPIPVGVSLGKNKDTPLEEAHTDYLKVLQRLYDHGDFFVINVSSPNTEKLRELQNRAYLTELVYSVQNEIKALSHGQLVKPLLIKISPDIPYGGGEDRLDDILDVALANKVAGIIATNTTIRRDALKSEHKTQSGGLSGAPLKQRSTDVVRTIYQRTQGKLTIIGVGGVASGDDIWDKIAAGASLVQAYTGWVYGGPLFVKRAINQLSERMEREGVSHISDLVGQAAKGEN